MRSSDLDFATLRIDRRGLVLEVTIDNPKGALNVVDGMLHEELAALFRELRSENDARAVLLTGSKRACCAGGGGTAIGPLVLGPARAKESLLTGDKVDAATAERIGLVNHVVPAADPRDAARVFADRLAAGAPLHEARPEPEDQVDRERRFRRRNGTRDRGLPERRPPGRPRGDSRETQASVQETLRGRRKRRRYDCGGKNASQIASAQMPPNSDATR